MMAAWSMAFCVIVRVRQEDPTADCKTTTSLMPWPDLGDSAGAAAPVRSARSVTHLTRGR
jgi:hypothetical protein